MANSRPRTLLHSTSTRVAWFLGAAAVIGIALVERPRAERAAADEIYRRIDEQIYEPLARARGQAQLLAGNTEVRQSVSDRNRLTLKRALSPALAQMHVNYVGVLLADGSPFFWVPDAQARAPLIVANRTPIEHELRTVGFLEYGSIVNDVFVQRLATMLSTELRLFSPDARPLAGSPAVPTPGAAPPSGRALSVTRGFAYAYLRQSDTLALAQGPIVAVLGFRVPPNTAAGTRIRRERNFLWGMTAAVLIAVTVYDARTRRRGAQAARPFTPIANPYIVGNPIRTTDMFFGRDDDFQFTQQKLMSERGGLVLVFCGERRSGKTSILFQILNGRLGAQFLPVLIDMQYFAGIGLAGGRDRDFYRTMFREIVRAVYPEGERQERLHRFDVLLTDSPGQSFEIVLNEAMAAHPDKGLLFLFDEYEILESKIERNELSRNVIPFLAGLLERSRRLAFIFTGSKNLEERASQHWRVMLGKSLYRKISYLTRQDTERLIRKPVEGAVEYDAAAVEQIYRLTSGQPFYTQVICQNLIDQLNETRQRQIGTGDVATIVDGIVDNPLPQMIYFWDSLPPDEKVALSMLAETLSDDSSWTTVPALLADATSKGVPVGIDEATLHASLERLFEKELVMKSADRAFQYRIDLLRHWIRRTHSIWQVVKEARGAFDATA